MKYLIIIIMGGLCACSPSPDLTPTHIGIGTGIEWEVSNDLSTKIKPRIETSIDWVI